MEKPAARGVGSSGFSRVLTAVCECKHPPRGSHRPVPETLTRRLDPGNGPVGLSLRPAGITVLRRKRAVERADGGLRPPYDLQRLVSPSTRSIAFNAVPLLFLAAAYLA